MDLAVLMLDQVVLMTVSHGSWFSTAGDQFGLLSGCSR